MVWRVGLYSDVTCSHYRRLAELQFMVWQVVWHCAAASGSGTAAGLQRAKRCESTPHRPPDCVKKSSLPRLSSFDSRCEYVLRGERLVRFTERHNTLYFRIAAPTLCNTRGHGKTRPAPIYGRTDRAVYRCYLHAPTSRLEPPSSGAESGCSARSGVKAPPSALQTASRNPVSLDSLHLIHGVNTFYAAKDLYALPNTTITSLSESPHPRPAATRVHGKTRPAPIYGRTGRAVQRCYLLALSKTCQTPIYGLASRVAPGGSKWKRHSRRVAAREAVWLQALPV